MFTTSIKHGLTRLKGGVSSISSDSISCLSIPRHRQLVKTLTTCQSTPRLHKKHRQTWGNPTIIAGCTQQLYNNVSLLSCISISIRMSSSTKKTRGTTALAEKEKYLKMPIAEKRKVYRCGKKYCTLNEDVPTWPEFYEENKERLQRLARKELFKPDKTYQVNPDLNKKISIWRGDITTLEIDAIVNAANNSLLGGGGVDGAIHSAAGSSLKAECATLGGCETGDAKITGGFKLPSKYIIHTVGPIRSSESKLKSCYQKCLKILKSEKLRSIAFPCISTGIYGYPNDQATPVALETARTFLEENHKEVDRIIFCLFMKVDVGLYEEMMQYYFPIGDGSGNTETNTPKQSAAAEENKPTDGDNAAASGDEAPGSPESKEPAKEITEEKSEGGEEAMDTSADGEDVEKTGGEDSGAEDRSSTGETETESKEEEKSVDEVSKTQSADSKTEEESKASPPQTKL